MKLDVVNIADQIMKAIAALGKEGERPEELIKAKAEAMGEYDKVFAVATAMLKAEGEPITIIDKLAKGRTSDLLIKRIVAEETLKAHYSKLDRLAAQLNALQSIFRHLENVGRGENEPR